jgi:P-type conjugative transfer protein TrbJ
MTGEPMKSLSKISLLVSIIYFFLTSTGQADWPVIDFSNLAQNAATASQTATQIIHQVTQIQNQLTMLKQLDPSTFAKVSGIYTQNNSDLDSILNNVGEISFDLTSVNDQVDKLYDSGFNAGTTQGQYASMFDKWNGNLLNSAKTSMRSQSLLSRVKDNNNSAIQILSQSAGATGVVGQLQNTNQMIGLVSNGLGNLTTVLTASSRLSATLAADEYSKRQASSAHSDQLLEGMQTSDKTFHSVTLPDIH